MWSCDSEWTETCWPGAHGRDRGRIELRRGPGEIPAVAGPGPGALTLHSQRSPEPGFLAQMRTEHPWDDLDGGDRRRIAMPSPGTSAAYCEQPCQPTRPSRTEGGEVPLTRRPSTTSGLARFPELWLDWTNLVYACYRCNQSKWDSWPRSTHEEPATGGRVQAQVRARFRVCSPNASDQRRPVPLTSSVDSGEILHSLTIRSGQRPATIDDVDLNDEISELGAYHRVSLVNQRRYRLYLLLEEISADPGRSDEVIRRATQPGRPFSSYLTAFFNDRFGGLA